MREVSEELLTQLVYDTRFLVRGSAVLASGSTVTLDYGNFSCENNTYSEGAGMNSLPLGACICKNVSIELDNYDGEFDDIDFNGAAITLYADYYLIESEEYESILLGTFYVNAPVTTGRYVNISAVDAMYKADVPYNSTVDLPSTIFDIFEDVLDCCGLVTEIESLPQGTLPISSTPAVTYTCRQMLNFVAEIAGGMFKIDNGKVTFKPISMGEPVFTLDSFFDLQHGSSVSTITGVAISDVVENENGQLETRVTLEGEEGYVINISADNPLIENNATDILEALGEQLIDMSFYSFGGEHTACPIIEAGDVVTLEDLSTFVSIVTDIDYEFIGQTTFKNTAETALTTGLKYTTPEERTILESNLRKASIEKSESNIRLYVAEQSAETLEDATAQIETVKTSVDVLAGEVDFNFENLTERVTDNESGIQDIKKYIRFVDGDIILGEEGNELTLKITNDEIGFFQNGEKVAWFSSNRLQVNESQFDKTLRLGSFAFVPQEDGGLKFKKV